MRVRPGMSRSACHRGLKCPSLPFQRLFRGLLLLNDFRQLFLCAFEPVLVWTTKHGCQAAPRQSNCTKIHSSAMIYSGWCDSAMLCVTVGVARCCTAMRQTAFFASPPEARFSCRRGLQHLPMSPYPSGVLQI